MTIKNPKYKQNESDWLDGLVTRDAEIDGISMIGDVDCRISDINTYRQVELEAKYILGGMVHVKTGQLLDKHVTQKNNPELESLLVAYEDHEKNKHYDDVWVMDLRETLKGKYFGRFGKDFDIDTDLVLTSRQNLNQTVNDWLTGKIPSLDLQSIKKAPLTGLAQYFWD